MKRDNCIVCGNKISHRINSVCCSKKCNVMMNKDAEYYYKVLEKEAKEHHKFRMLLRNKLAEMKKENRSNQNGRYRGEAKIHKIRKIVTKNRTGDVYGITLPKSIHKKFKDFTFEHYSNGIIVLVPEKIRKETLKC